MLSVHGAAADVDGGAVDFVDVEEIEGYAGAYDIGDGIGCAYFVEVHFFDGDAVDLGFGFGQALEDGGGVLFGAGGDFRVVDDLENVG